MFCNLLGLIGSHQLSGDRFRDRGKWKITLMKHKWWWWSSRRRFRLISSPLERW
ncbi:hypothetical protein HanXRQr2_Chr01g0020621 [Helianthus annuus]|uniref:Uncharacterized protein n=1 Tax=Helianthus annuus TaxID=4232 RepID=A0A9K3P4E0_HELAN|nr:hypothetical protein HanXRQr2_Chr01g0020621 [Helianthus annuus]KAJ0956820.1 hypothetical protein HanPSC8_Chr01g0019991 [Helianthus annuus]